MTDGAQREDLVPQDSYANAGRSAQHEHGVIYQGEFETPWDGTASAVRLHARALAAQGVPVLLRSFSNCVINADGVAEPVHIAGIPDEVRAEVGDLIDTSIRTAAPIIKHLVVRSGEHLRQVIVPRGAIAQGEDANIMIKMRNSIYDNTILYTVWERDRIDKEIVKHLSRVAEVWVPCRNNQAMLLANGVPNVHVVPHPFSPTSDILKLTRRPAVSEAKRTKKFYSIGRWEPRKGFAETIQAFLAAYSPGDKATLVIKYSGGHWQGYPTPEEALAAGVSTSTNGWTMESALRHVALIGGKLPRSRIVELHFRNNIYVSASHGEAFALPAFEAKLAGNALVHVPWGGTEEFSSVAEIDDRVIPWELGPVHASYGWGSGARWAVYKIEDLIEALKSASPPEQFLVPTELHQRFSMAAVGQLMLERVHAVLAASNRKIRYGT